MPWWGASASPRGSSPESDKSFCSAEDWEQKRQFSFNVNKASNAGQGRGAGEGLEMLGLQQLLPGRSGQESRHTLPAFCSIEPALHTDRRAVSADLLLSDLAGSSEVCKKLDPPSENCKVAPVAQRSSADGSD